MLIHFTRVSIRTNLVLEIHDYCVTRNVNDFDTGFGSDSTVLTTDASIDYLHILCAD